MIEWRKYIARNIRYITIILAITVSSISIIAMGTTACDLISGIGDYGDTDPDEDTPIICPDTNATGISTAVGLQAIKDTLDGNFCLGEDIDLASITDFEPIGTSTTPFTGTLDGNSKKISNLSINRLSESQIGLFGVTSSAATIKDLTIENVTILSGNTIGALVGENGGTIANVTISGTSSLQGRYYLGGLVGQNIGATITNSTANTNITTIGTDTRGSAGGLVGYNHSNSTITDSSASGIVNVGTLNKVGGLVGNNDNSNITNSQATGNITGSSNVGGLIGENNDTSNITNSYATGTITATQVAGGLIGLSLEQATITDSYATGSITTTDDKTGGLIGRIYSTTAAATVTNCYATGNVSGQGYTGGLVGDADNATITNSYASGTVDGSGGRVGGLLGLLGNANLSKSYSTGNITGTSSMGGLIGASGGGNTIEDSYSTGNVTGSTTTYLGGFVGNPSSSIADTIRRCYSTGAVSSGKGGFSGSNPIAIVLADNYFDTASAGTTDEAGTENVSGITGIVAGDIGSGGTTPFQSNNWDFTTVWNAEGTGTWPTLK